MPSEAGERSWHGWMGEEGVVKGTKLHLKIRTSMPCCLVKGFSVGNHCVFKQRSRRLLKCFSYKGAMDVYGNVFLTFLLG